MPRDSNQIVRAAADTSSAIDLSGGSPPRWQIRELAINELSRTLPLLSRLYTKVSNELLAARINEISQSNWRCLGVFDEDKLIGLSGYWLNTRLYCGKYLYVDHFIIDDDYRCFGIGTVLLAELKQLAIEHDCEQVCLDTFVTNSVAQKFWFRHGFNIVGFHFVAECGH
jgi:GNAT superfamily N-acetyltransferase